MILIFSLIAFLSLAGCLWVLLWPRPYRLEDREEWDITDLIARHRR